MKSLLTTRQLDATPNVNFLATLRNSGYDNYSAICDIVDNSLDTDVNSKNVSITVRFSSKDKEFISICDDGCGMDFDTISEAVRLGAETGKSRQSDLGSYGTGLKSAALSLGRKFTIFTKTNESDLIVVEYDLDSMVELNSFNIPVRLGTDDEMKYFQSNVNNISGTIILIEILDRITNNNVTIFKDTLSKNLGKTFMYFIDEKNINLTINGDVVNSIDPMCRKHQLVTRLTGVPYESYVYKDKEIKYNVFYIEKIEELPITRNSSNAGLWIYRNNRLVGQGLDLGLIGKSGDGYLNGLRIELFVDGECDNFFGSTFTKTISEKEKNHVDQGFRDVSTKALGAYIKTSRMMEKSKQRDKVVSEDIIASLEEAFRSINNNKMVNVKKTGENEKNNSDSEKKETINKGKNKFSPRKREDSFAKYRLVSLGECGNIFRPFKEMGKFVIEINQDHPFWTGYLSQQELNTISVVSKLFVSMSLALESSSYYCDSEKEDFFDEYFAEWSIQARKLILY
jgi:hypothetical protein